MKDFQSILKKTGEIGFIEEVIHSIVYARGLPGARVDEIILFEDGQFGQVLSLGEHLVEILVFSKKPLRSGMQVIRTNQLLEIPVDKSLLGHTIDPFGTPLDPTSTPIHPETTRPIDIQPGGIETRKRINKAFDTGIALVDLNIPLGKGQRQLIIGDRKTGKTSFLLQTILYQAQLGTLCIYAGIGKKSSDIKKVEEYFTKQGIMQKTIIVASNSHDPSGVIFLTPYAAMTLAEYFRDQGRDVLLVLDDLSTHAKFYREISLIGKRFPGRNAYPGDIFYTHAKLLERAGNFATPQGETSITCLPIVETVQGDLSGYIQTNIMSMTDGHIFFDIDYFTKGRRPAVNTFLSVTRVGRQTQSLLLRTISRELTSFFTLYEKMQNYVHFGAELTASVRETLKMGEKVTTFFDISSERVVSPNLQIFLFSLLWISYWQDKSNAEMQKDIDTAIAAYATSRVLRDEVNSMVMQSESFNGLLTLLRPRTNDLLTKAGLAPSPLVAGGKKP